MTPRDTIVALSSGAGKAGIAVIRASGPGAAACIRHLAGADVPPRRAALRVLRDGAAGETVDSGLVLWLPGPGSVTGEDVAEFQVHGSPAVVGRLLSVLCALDGVRPAEPGEFTRRAFENGRMDLSEAEGLADLIDAETEAQRVQAQRQMDGAFAERCADWGAQLRRSLAWLEAAIDFPDEALPNDLAAQVRPAVEAVAAGLAGWLAAPDRGRMVREGYRVAIVGAPNVGKSSLLNRLAQRDVAIVAETAGTTRDVIEVRADLAGYAVIFADTAGLRDDETAGDIEREGMARARFQAGNADLVLHVVDASAPAAGPSADVGAGPDRVLTVANKTDLAPAPPDVPLGVSARTGDGIGRLLAAIEDRVTAAMGAAEHPALTRLRHRQCLEDASAALERALAATGAELTAEDLRLALRAMDRLIGRTDVEDLLDLIFRDFCIGK
ncbi:MAG: tRNA uridine-5-carboxymethylaminomethyl(34) synthesis GTPase MnmE [Rhodospirillaceae bacterium]|nr:tRNA uridine-5-carboxymethylaminomethyl(34) synthesis GTPase MnmE [Rhodospirillaceae bacterium]MDE0618610.1 tRNA uridine-5-carboxymethylaminomethyl(34) synthesis GTPase MnmE [Rhodospirillaceae bacterium]